MADPALRPARPGELAHVCAFLQGAGLPPYDLTARHLRRFTVLEEDGQIVMRVKRGFVWRDQVLRPEEVVAKRFG